MILILIGILSIILEIIIAVVFAIIIMAVLLGIDSIIRKIRKMKEAKHHDSPSPQRERRM